MDYRLGILLQSYQGLKLTDEDLDGLLSTSGESINHPAEALERLVSSPAHAHFKSHSNWVAHLEEVLRQSTEHGIRWSYLGRSDYPELWGKSRKRPLLFNYKGQPVWQQYPLISVVGSRTPMVDTSLWLQREFSAFLRSTRVGVASGGARGVDQWAHRLALAAGRPTVCILPSGLCNPYPPMSDALWEAILLQDGCMLSTFPLHQPMHKHMFPTRNHWIAGLSRLTFIVEANRRSGSFLTAEAVVKEGRELCTLPVAANSTQGLANLDLLADGAQLIRHADDLKTACSRHYAGI